MGHLSHVAAMVGSAFVDEFVAVHMTWGAVNELSTLTGYHALIDQTDHPVLTDMLTAIIKDQRRHFAFYRTQGTTAPGTQRPGPQGHPLGDGQPLGSRRHRSTAPGGDRLRHRHLFGDQDGAERMQGIDDTIRELPGFEDAALLRDARHAAMQRMTPSMAEDLTTDRALERAGIHLRFELQQRSIGVA